MTGVFDIELSDDLHQRPEDEYSEMDEDQEYIDVEDVRLFFYLQKSVCDKTKKLVHNVGS